MKKLILVTLLLFAPFFAFAGGHSALSASGTGVRIDLKTIEGTSGNHVQATTSDIWMYENPPEGFHKAMKVNCNYFQVLLVVNSNQLGELVPAKHMTRMVM